jgi:hypothetical protein
MIKENAMELQLSMFDVKEQQTLFDVESPSSVGLSMSEKEMVKLIGKEVGLNFIYVDDFWKWRAKTKCCTFSLHYSNYNTLDERNGQRFISCGYDYKKDGQIGGCGSPCDTIEKAIKFLKTGKEGWC